MTSPDHRPVLSIHAFGPAATRAVSALPPDPSIVRVAHGCFGDLTWPLDPGAPQAMTVFADRYLSVVDVDDEPALRAATEWARRTWRENDVWVPTRGTPRKPTLRAAVAKLEAVAGPPGDSATTGLDSVVHRYR